MVNNYDDLTADDKKEPYTLEITPGKWSIAYYSDEDGYVIDITNLKNSHIQIDTAAFEVLKGMMANIALFLKTYVKLGDDVK